jgi:translation elongation factor EF-Tu-like GTPase
MAKKFDMREFVLKNLYDGYRNGSFTYQQVSIFATNFAIKGIISQEDVIELMAKIDAYIEEQEKKTEEVVEEPVEEPTEP